MNPYIFPPHARAFWTPIIDGLIAGFILGGIGLAWIGDGLVAATWGLIAFGFVWAPARIAWMRVILRYYHHEPPEETPEVDTEEEVIGTMYSANQDGTHILVLSPPCTRDQLWSWCIGMGHAEDPTYEEWVIKKKVFTQAEYSAFRQWLFDRRLANQTIGSQIQLTSSGHEMVEMILSRGILASPPLPTGGPVKYA